MLHEPRCHKCGGNARLVAYRRNEGSPEWTCARCAGAADSSYRGFGRSAAVEVDAEATPRLPPVSRRSLPYSEPPSTKTEMKPKYMGPRARHDPLRY